MHKFLKTLNRQGKQTKPRNKQGRSINLHSKRKPHKHKLNHPSRQLNLGLLQNQPCNPLNRKHLSQGKLHQARKPPNPLPCLQICNST